MNYIVIGIKYENIHKWFILLFQTLTENAQFINLNNCT